MHSLGVRPSKNRKGGSGKQGGMEVLQANSHTGRRDSDQIPIRILYCILSSRVLGVNVIGTCSERENFR